MKELCDVLDISLNELLLGNKLMESEYKENAEKILFAIMEKHQNNKVKKLENIIRQFLLL